jgi:maleate isomerase
LPCRSLDDALESVLKIEPDYLILGYSAPGWRVGADAALRSRLETAAGIGVSTPGSAFASALPHLCLKSIAIISPYPTTFLPTVNNFFTELGVDVATHVAIPCASAIDIAKVTERTLLDAIRSADAPGIDGIGQVGGPMLPVVDMAERWIDKPVLSMTSVLLWHALRSNQFDDVVKGAGLILRS